MAASESLLLICTIWYSITIKESLIIVFHICPARPAVVPELNRFIQLDELIAIYGFTQSCLQALTELAGIYTTTNQNG
jgi:hypothetical protein